MTKKRTTKKGRIAAAAADTAVAVQKEDRNEIGRRRRKLWLHAGGEKAGSSALQNTFGQITAQLAQHDVAYANDVEISHPLEFTNGNGKLLFDSLTAPAIDRQRLQSLLLSYFGVHKQAICSSECFCRMELPRWKLLADLCDDLYIELHVVYYVRDVVDHYLSQYDQHIKHHWEWREISDWIVGFPWLDASALNILSNVVAADKLHVRHYVSGTTDMLRSFLDVLAVPAVAKNAARISKTRVNRSLTNYERERLKGLNKHFYYLQTGVVADQILYANPDLESDPVTIPPDTLKSLATSVSGDLKRINATFFPHGDGVVFKAPVQSRTIGMLRKGGPKNSGSASQAIATTERIIADWAFEGLSKIREEAFLWVAQVFRNVTTPAQRDARLPADFDPVAYLLSNFDLLSAGVEPYTHFLSAGHNEGRNWTWAMNRESPWSK